MGSLWMAELGGCMVRILVSILPMMLSQMLLCRTLGGLALLPHLRNLVVRREQRDLTYLGSR
jgi:hypothetical protein